MIPQTLLLAGLLLGANPMKPDDAADAAKTKVDDFVQKAGGQRAVVQPVKDDALAKLFPKHRFATVLFRLFPVAMAPPRGMKSSNVFAVPGEGDPILITAADGLKSFFEKNLPAIKTEADGKAVLAAWLRLSYEFSQDGFFKFSIPEKDLRFLGAEENVKVFTGKAVVDATGGNKGEIVATLHVFKEKLDKVEEQRKVIAGPRPRCQSTKLLDPDPLVRLMAEDSLRIMGRAAKPYLDEQRAKASPELQQAIDRIWQRIVEEDR